ncbi:MAG: 7-cyano-7-deazaguanine synthase [Imperialibacter sp.]|uniref:7-cyano-7-deazaguanine synthase n=1 Tax=Imperialibacter sp. TaxID=2038411 RepID=UPI0032EB4B72
MEEKAKGRVLLLFSGGIDSTACIQWYLDLGYSINPLFIKFGQLSEHLELKSARQICAFYQLDLIELKVQSRNSFSSGEILGRNLMFLATALFNIGENEVISLGIHSGTGYYDCSEAFVNSFNRIVSESTDGTARLEAPFVNWNKKQIWEYCQVKKIPIELTYSCEKGGQTMCGKCATCRDLIMLYGK